MDKFMIELFSKKNWLPVCLFIMGILGATQVQCMAPMPTGTSLLRHISSIPLDNVSGRIDHMCVDADGKYLYIAALGNNTVEIIDLKKGKRTSRITGIKKPQGILILPESGNLIVAGGDDGTCRMYSPAQVLLGTIEGLDDADNVRYDAEAKIIYVGYGDGALAVIAADKFTKLADIILEGHPESFRLETKSSSIFVNVPTAGHIAVIDRKTRTVMQKWPIKNAKANFSMAIDEVNNRLFVGCRVPPKLVVIDTKSGKAMAVLDCCGDIDDVFYDPAGKLVYLSGGNGYVDVIEQIAPNRYRLTGKIKTAVGARTSLFVPQLKRLFVAVPARGEQKTEIRVYETSLKEP